jgi:hypothetical protein
LYYLDETGFCLIPSAPYGWQDIGEYLGLAEKVIKKQDQDWSVIQASPKYNFFLFLIG